MESIRLGENDVTFGRHAVLVPWPTSRVVNFGFPAFIPGKAGVAFLMSIVFHGGDYDKEGAGNASRVAAAAAAAAAKVM